MAWLSVDKKGNERIHEDKPVFDGFEWYNEQPYTIEGEDGIVSMDICLPQDTIEKILGYKLTFENSPIEIV